MQTCWEWRSHWEWTPQTSLCTLDSGLMKNGIASTVTNWLAYWQLSTRPSKIAHFKFLDSAPQAWKTTWQQSETWPIGLHACPPMITCWVGARPSSWNKTKMVAKPKIGLMAWRMSSSTILLSCRVLTFKGSILRRSWTRRKQRRTRGRANALSASLDCRERLSPWRTSRSAKSLTKAALARCSSFQTARWVRCTPWSASTRTFSSRKSKSRTLRMRRTFYSKRITPSSTRWTSSSRTNLRSTFSSSTFQGATFMIISTKCAASWSQLWSSLERKLC